MNITVDDKLIALGKAMAKTEVSWMDDKRTTAIKNRQVDYANLKGVAEAYVMQKAIEYFNANGLAFDQEGMLHKLNGYILCIIPRFDHSSRKKKIEAHVLFNQRADKAYYYNEDVTSIKALKLMIKEQSKAYGKYRAKEAEADLVGRTLIKRLGKKNVSDFRVNSRKKVNKLDLYYKVEGKKDDAYETGVRGEVILNGDTFRVKYTVGLAVNNAAEAFALIKGIESVVNKQTRCTVVRSRHALPWSELDD